MAVYTKEGMKKLIYDVLHMPILTQNLLSVRHMLQNRYMVIFDNGEYKILDKDKNTTLMAKVKMTQNKVFALNMPIKQNLTLKNEKIDESYLWHMRYGHLNYKGINLLKGKDIF